MRETSQVLKEQAYTIWRWKMTVFLETTSTKLKSKLSV